MHCSNNHKLLGKSLMMDKDCDTLLDIDKKEVLVVEGSL
jgi:hypothetical protein